MNGQMLSYEVPKVSIDKLAPQKSHIDLTDKSLPTDFGMDDYVFTDLMDDFILIEYADIVDAGPGGMAISRGGIAIPITQIHNAWRKGKVLLTGPNCASVKKGDIVVFPSNMGIGISNLEIEGDIKVKDGLFLNEQRIFGICRPK